MKKTIFLFTLAIAGHLHASDMGCKLHIDQSNPASLTKFSSLLKAKGYKIVANQKEADLVLIAHSYCSYVQKSTCYRNNARIEILDQKTGEIGHFLGEESTLMLEASSSKALEKAVRNIDRCK